MYDTSYYGASDASALIELFSSGVSSIISLGWTLLTYASLWKIFEKCGEKGWKSIIPVYNWIVLFELAGLKTWYVALALIPCIGIFILMVFIIIAYAKIAKKLGKEGAGFVLLIIFFTPIALAVLAFDKKCVLNQNTQQANNQFSQNMMNQQMMDNNQAIPPQDFNQQFVTPNNTFNNPVNNNQPIPPVVDNNITMEQQPVEPITTMNEVPTPVAPVTENTTVQPEATIVEPVAPVVEEQTPITPPVESTIEEPTVNPVVENNVSMEQQPVEPITTMNEVPTPVAPVTENTTVIPIVEDNQPVVEQTVSEPTVDPLQNIEPPIIPVISDDNNNNM